MCYINHLSTHHPSFNEHYFNHTPTITEVHTSVLVLSSPELKKKGERQSVEIGELFGRFLFRRIHGK